MIRRSLLDRRLSGGSIAVLAVIGASLALLHHGHLRDPLLFDSLSWFSEENLRGLHDLSSTDRYVSRTFTYWLWQLTGGRLELLHGTSLLLHAACAYATFLLSRRLMQVVLDRKPGPGPAIAVAALFTVHPVQVYAVAYLGQMELLLATFWGVLMLLAYLEGLVASSRALLLLSVLLYLLAVLSKESLGALPAVALALTLLARRPSSALIRAVWPYFALYGAIALGTTVREIGSPQLIYELDAMSARAPLHDVHMRSLVTQGYLFFGYLARWLVPHPAGMSIDVQYPLAGGIAVWPETAGLVAFCLYPLGAGWLLWRGGRAGLVGFALLWPWLLFLPELATVRFTETLVLYRSYPWIGGFLLALVLSVAPLVGRGGVALACIAVAALGGVSRERLATFGSAHALWDDAVEKNRPYERRTAGTYRAYLNRGVALLRLGRTEAALRDLATALELRPNPYAHFNRGLAYVDLRRYPEALTAFDEAIRVGDEMPAGVRAAAHSNRAGVNLLLGRPRDAIDDLARAVELDPGRAQYRVNLERLRAEVGQR